MMIAQVDKMSPPPSRERAQRLYDKITELKNRLRRSAQARVPSDPNAWQQIRENYESIILEDHDFSEQHGIEYALWQLHYMRIEDLRAQLASAGSISSQVVRGPNRPDRVTKVRLQFKIFLSEATGFYQELIVKIRAKYGLPLGYFSEDFENRIVMDKDGKKYDDMKKGLISCHRCLIFLGDLARYKGLYGKGDAKTPEFAAASSYYLQAASLWPSSGNPQHQLAILASYSGDDLVAVYRYFRSLAADSPSSTARDNLIVVFEKNRQCYSQLPGNMNAYAVKESARLTSKSRGKGEAVPASKDNHTELSLVKGTTFGTLDTYKAFCVRFIRLNGILFTRTSLETFTEVLSVVRSGLCELLSSGTEEQLNLSFGADAVEDGLFIVRLISILIFTVHNVKKESEGHTYAEIVQRDVLLQNAFTAVFELMGYILERCVQMCDLSSSYLLPGILVFVEWLACSPDVVAGTDTDKKQSSVRTKFWNVCTSFLNKLLSKGPMSIDDEDETCFNNMSRYEEGETENRLALWEDIELRGFIPLLPAQKILNFLRKHSCGGDGQKENGARVKRILAAGKALMSVVKVDQKRVYFDSKGKKFVIGFEPPMQNDFIRTSHLGMANANDNMQENQVEKTVDLGVAYPKPELTIEGDEEDEVIVFKPIVTEKRPDVVSTPWAAYEGLEPVLDLKVNGTCVSAPCDNLHHQTVFSACSQLPVSVANGIPQHLQPIQSHASNWSTETDCGERQHLSVSIANSISQNLQPVQSHALKMSMEEEMSLANNLTSMGFMENGRIRESDPVSLPLLQLDNGSTSGMFYRNRKDQAALLPMKADPIASSGAIPGSSIVKTSSDLPTGIRRNPVPRPVRHLGPPPGFSPVPLKNVNESLYGSESMGENLMMDDYSWLDGYQMPSSTKGKGLSSSVNFSPHSNPHQFTNNNGISETVNFPFPGKQGPPVPFQVDKQKSWKDCQMLDDLKLHHEMQLQQQQQRQQLMNGNQHVTPQPEQYQGPSVWSGRYLV